MGTWRGCAWMVVWVQGNFIVVCLREVNEIHYMLWMKWSWTTLYPLLACYNPLLSCYNPLQHPCCTFERGWPPCFYHVTILLPPSPLSPRSTETKWRTGANSSSRKKWLTKPRSLTNTNLILIRIEKNCLCHVMFSHVKIWDGLCDDRHVYMMHICNMSWMKGEREWC